MRSVKAKSVAGILSALAVATGSLTLAAIGSPAGATTSSTTSTTAGGGTTSTTAAGGTTSTTTPTTTTCGSTGRLAGIDRIATAIAISQDAFTANGSAKAVVLAQDLDFPDALAGGPLAADAGGPLLLTAPGGLTASTLTEIKRVLPAGGTVIILGGSAAVDPSVDGVLTTAGFKTSRLSGTNRFATAVAVANAINPTTVFEATGLDFPDALSAGPAAVLQHAAILLTNGSTQAPETAAYLSMHTMDTRIAIGGPAATADTTATPYGGSDRFATSAAVATKFFPGAKAVGVVSGLDFPDALTAVPLLGPAGVPMLLVSPTGALPPSISTYLTANMASILAVAAFGGTTALSQAVVTEITSSLPAFSSTNSANCTPGSTTSTTTGTGSTTSTTTGTGTGTGSNAGLGGVLSILSGLTGGSGTSGGLGFLSGLTSILGGGLL